MHNISTISTHVVLATLASLAIAVMVGCTSQAALGSAEALNTPSGAIEYTPICAIARSLEPYSIRTDLDSHILYDRGQPYGARSWLDPYETSDRSVARRAALNAFEDHNGEGAAGGRQNLNYTHSRTFTCWSYLTSTDHGPAAHTVCAMRGDFPQDLN